MEPVPHAPPVEEISHDLCGAGDSSGEGVNRARGIDGSEGKRVRGVGGRYGICQSTDTGQ